MAQYQYSKLSPETQEIRLVRLLPGRFDEPLRVEIFNTPLFDCPKAKSGQMTRDELQSTVSDGWSVRQTLEGRYLFTKGSHINPPYNTSWVHPISNFDVSLYEGYVNDPDPAYQPNYEALSYVWGTNDSNEVLYIVQDGGEASAIATLGLRENLAHALKSLRYEDSPRTLWIDAICVNQQSIPERNEQVPRMGLIYKSASRVVAWLGLAEADSALALSTLQHLGHQVEFSVDHYFIRNPDAEYDDWYLPDTVLPYDDKVWQSLEHLFQRSWLERVWVVQEIGLANRFSFFQCGQETISWGAFRRAITLLDDKVLPSVSLQKRLNSTALVTAETTWSTKRLLIVAREKKCMDPRDKLYGMLSIMPPRVQSQILPDYWLSPAEIYRNAFAVSLEVSKRLTWLRYSSPDRNLSELPSWVPDWSSEPSVASLLWDYLASGFSCAEHQYQGKEVLQITGVKAATITHVGEAMNDGLQQLWKVWDELKSEELETIYPTGQPMLDAFISAITLDRQKGLFPRHSYPTLGEWKSLFATKASSVWISRLCRFLKGRSFMTTGEGYIGFGPPWAKKGDIVAIILGCQSPMLLRPSSRLQDKYEVVGECHIHGIMFGEVLLGPLKAGQGIHIDISASGAYTYTFVDTASEGTPKTLLEDPRLGPLHDEWESLHTNGGSTDDPPIIFRNRNSGVELNSDPRMLPGALRKRGIDLDSFKLV